MKTLKIETSRELKKVLNTLTGQVAINGIIRNTFQFECTNKYLSYYSTADQGMIYINAPYSLSN